MNILSNLRKNIRNIPGWRTNRKILVFESDDWGSERARNYNTVQSLSNAGYGVQKCSMSMNDSLESNTDMELLFDLLTQYKDKQNNHPVVTGFFNVANPDYQKIRESNFEEYHYLTISETAAKYHDHDRLLKLYGEGIKAKVFHAEYHGREHLHVKRWLRDLQAGHSDTLLGFELEFNGFSKSYAPAISKMYRASYDLDTPPDIDFMKRSIIDGLHLFKDIFNYNSSYFVPPNGIYPRSENFEEILKENGVKFLGGASRQKVPDGIGGYKTKHFPLGSRNKNQQIYITRNGIFEPQSINRDWVSYCLEDIRMAFRWGKPAIISSHRANFVGTINPKNRENGLRFLGELLGKILKQWPEVEFMSSKNLNALVSTVN